jgi:hydroxypyruvate isomerase
MRFSANLGFLWTDLPLPAAIRAAKRAGFDAVECHWPYEVPVDAMCRALDETGLPMLGLNTRRGDLSRGENGLAALPGRGAEARAAVDEALGYACAIGAQSLHVMAGVAEGPEARAAFFDTLRYACDRAAPHRITILIEPLNRYDAPGYFLNTTAQAQTILAELGRTNARLMFDCYHVGRTEGDVIARLETLWPMIGHIQFAAVPDRGAPDHGDLDYRQVFRAIARLGWTRPLGAEYRPGTETGASLDWLDWARRL